MPDPLVKSVKADIVIPVESEIVRIDVFQLATTNRNIPVRMKIHICLGDEERMFRDATGEVLIERDSVVDGPGRKLAMEVQIRCDVSIRIEPQPVSASKVLQLSTSRKV